MARGQWASACCILFWKIWYLFLGVSFIKSIDKYADLRICTESPIFLPVTDSFWHRNLFIIRNKQFLPPLCQRFRAWIASKVYDQTTSDSYTNCLVLSRIILNWLRRLVLSSLLKHLCWYLPFQFPLCVHTDLNSWAHFSCYLNT